MAIIDLTELPLRAPTATSGATTVTFNGNVIGALDEGILTLLTQNKYCTGSIEIDTDNTVLSLDVLYGSMPVLSISGAHSYQLLTSGKFLNSNIVLNCHSGTASGYVGGMEGGSLILPSTEHPLHPVPAQLMLSKRLLN